MIIGGIGDSLVLELARTLITNHVKVCLFQLSMLFHNFDDGITQIRAAPGAFIKRA